MTFLTDERLAEINRGLGEQPFRGVAIACPFTPNVFKQPSTVAALDRYAAWVAERLLPEIERHVDYCGGLPEVAVDGVSLGGFVSLEVFLRRPTAFVAVGATQGAFGPNLVDTYVARLRAAFDSSGPRPVRLATSSWDKGRMATVRLAKKLEERGVNVTLVESPGPHDQRWLCEAGSLELLWHYDRALGPCPMLVPVSGKNR